MTAWQIIPVQKNNGVGYEWKWQYRNRLNNVQASQRSFAYFYDCVLDAKKHGFNPDAPRIMR